MDLFLGIYLLSHPKFHCDYLHFAAQLLRIFVQKMENFYGPQGINFNEHILIHLAADLSIHWPLDTFSAFPYESFLGKLRKDVSGPSNAAAQIWNRISEKSAAATNLLPSTSLTDDIGCVIKNHVRGGCLWGSVVFTSHRPNNAAIVNGKPCFITTCGTNHISFHRFKTVSPFFLFPMNSTKLHIYRVHGEIHHEYTFPINKIDCKCCAFPDGDDFIFIPLLHSYNK